MHIRGVYFVRVLCCVRRRVQTFALALNDDTGDVTDIWRASPPASGKPEGDPTFPLEPWVQGRFARIGMVEDAPAFRVALGDTAPRAHFA